MLLLGIVIIAFGWFLIFFFLSCMFGWWVWWLYIPFMIVRIIAEFLKTDTDTAVYSSDIEPMATHCGEEWNSKFKL